MIKIVQAFLVCLLFPNFSQAQTNPAKIAQSEANARDADSTILERR
jgi:hypothetical protein